MSVPSPFLINSFASFFAYYLSSLLVLTSSVFGRLTGIFNSKKLPSKLKSATGVN